LGIKDVKSFNKALISKWMWKLKVDSTCTWREVVLSKYVTVPREELLIKSSHNHGGGGVIYVMSVKKVSQKVGLIISYRGRLGPGAIS